MVIVLGQKHSVLTLDEAIYCKAREIIWQQPKAFPDTVLRLGGMHIVLNFLSVIGKMFDNSGLEDLLVESGVYAPNTAAYLLKGKCLNRGICAHKLVAEALERLCVECFEDWCNTNEKDPDVEAVMIGVPVVEYDAATEAFKEGSTSEKKFSAVTKLSNSLDPHMHLMERFIEESSKKSKLFNFWMLYIKVVHILLNFIRVERERNWLLYLDSAADMLPFFFAYDHPNYSRWLTMYICDMQQLSHTAPEVYAEFIQGYHAISKSGKPSSSVWTDMALEQSENHDAKLPGGIIGVSRRNSALNKWFLTAHQRSSIVTAIKDMCNVSNEDFSTHKEAGSNCTIKDESDVQAIISTINTVMKNPFAGYDCDVLLSNLARGISLPEAETDKLLQCQKAGEEARDEFVASRMQLHCFQQFS